VRAAAIAPAIGARHVRADQHTELYRFRETVSLMAPHRQALHRRRQIDPARPEAEAARRTGDRDDALVGVEMIVLGRGNVAQQALVARRRQGVGQTVERGICLKRSLHHLLERQHIGRIEMKAQMRGNLGKFRRRWPVYGHSLTLPLDLAGNLAQTRMFQ
jgi:hypothetical protein